MHLLLPRWLGWVAFGFLFCVDASSCSSSSSPCGNGNGGEVRQQLQLAISGSNAGSRIPYFWRAPFLPSLLGIARERCFLSFFLSCLLFCNGDDDSRTEGRALGDPLAPPPLRPRRAADALAPAGLVIADAARVAGRRGGPTAPARLGVHQLRKTRRKQIRRDPTEHNSKQQHG
uniref:Secreted protein n=1 Tax=Oryza brachyantha TaxID=4533 RepID=J3MVB7_ORYBR